MRCVPDPPQNSAMGAWPDGLPPGWATHTLSGHRGRNQVLESGIQPAQKECAGLSKGLHKKGAAIAARTGRMPQQRAIAARSAPSRPGGGGPRVLEAVVTQR